MHALHLDAERAQDGFGAAVAEINRARIEGRPHAVDTEKLVKQAYTHAAQQVVAIAAIQCDLSAQAGSPATGDQTVPSALH